MSEIERDLERLGQLVAYPEPHERMPALSRRPVARPQRWRPAMAVGGVVLLAVLFVAPVRDAVARWFGLGVVSIIESEAVPPAALLTVDGLGETVAVADAAAVADISVPDLVGRGQPDLALVRELPDGRDVSFVWVDHSDPKGVSMLLSILEGRLGAPLIEKVIGPDAEYREVTVGGHDGLWLEGAHYFAYFGADGLPEEDSVRLAGNVLLWEFEGRTWRLEGFETFELALQAAEALGA